MRNDLKQRREELGLTLQEVADYVGVSAGTVSRWESGSISNMKRDKIARLSEILKMKPSVITGWETVKLDNGGNVTDFVLRSEELEIIMELRKNEPLTTDSIIRLLDLAKTIKEERGYKS